MYEIYFTYEGGREAKCASKSLNGDGATTLTPSQEGDVCINSVQLPDTSRLQPQNQLCN